MKPKLGIAIFGIIEIAIGAITFLSVALSLILGRSTKPLEVLIFVLTTSIISFCIGIGILRKHLTSYHILLFFAKVVILSKILIFANIISLSGAIETTIPQPFKNIISIFYHVLLLWYFSQASVRTEFGERRRWFIF